MYRNALHVTLYSLHCCSISVVRTNESYLIITGEKTLPQAPGMDDGKVSTKVTVEQHYWSACTFDHSLSY